METTAPDRFHSFLLECRTFDPGFNEPRLIPDWPLVEKASSALDSCDRLIVVKSRQMLVTWIGCAYMLYRALTGGPGIHLLLSKEERSARELIQRINFLYEYLPEELKTEEVKFQAGSMAVPSRGSRIISLPAAPYAVRGLSPRTVFWDEMAFTPFDEEIWASVKPAVDAGGRFFGVSTPNGPAGVFAKLVHQKEEEFTVIRIHYREHIERDSEWENGARAGLSPACWRREQELSFEGAEGCVYDQFNESDHLLDDSYSPGNTPGALLLRGIDFGYKFPAVVWAEAMPSGELILFDSLVGDKWPISQLVTEIRRVDTLYGLNEKDIAWTAVDPAGAAKTDFGISPVEHLQCEGFKLIWGPSSISSGIEAVRALLRDATGRVRMCVDRRCVRLIQAFQGYMWGPDGELPVKDGTYDHPMDALRYLVVNLYRSQQMYHGPAPKIRGLPPPPRTAPL